MMSDTEPICRVQSGLQTRLFFRLLYIPTKFLCWIPTRWHHMLPLFVSHIPDPSATGLNSLPISQTDCGHMLTHSQLCWHEVSTNQCKLYLITPCWPQATVCYVGVISSTYSQTSFSYCHNHDLYMQSIWYALGIRGISVYVVSCTSTHQQEPTLVVCETKWRIFYI